MSAAGASPQTVPGMGVHAGAKQDSKPASFRSLARRFRVEAGKFSGDARRTDLASSRASVEAAVSFTVLMAASRAAVRFSSERAIIRADTRLVHSSGTSASEIEHLTAPVSIPGSLGSKGTVGASSGLRQVRVAVNSAAPAVGVGMAPAGSSGSKRTMRVRGLVRPAVFSGRPAPLPDLRFRSRLSRPRFLLWTRSRKPL